GTGRLRWSSLRGRRSVSGRATPSNGSGRSSAVPRRPRTGSPIQTVFYGCGPCTVVGELGRTTAGASLLALVAATVILAGAASAEPRLLAAPTGAIVVSFNVQVDPGAADYVQRASQQPLAENK